MKTQGIFSEVNNEIGEIIVFWKLISGGRIREGADAVQEAKEAWAKGSGSRRFMDVRP
jgi:hypothetical protein